MTAGLGDRVKHVFVLMLENCSFDHVFGFAGISGLDALTGLPTNLEGLVGDEANAADGVRYQVSQDAPFAMHEDPGHGFLDVVEQLAGVGSTYPAPNGGYPDADMSGFASNLAPAGTHAAIAVTIQESRAWGRLRDRPRAERALLQSMKAIEKLPSVDNPQHHFVFDQAKFLHYAHTTYSWLDMPEQTERYARQAIAEFSDPAGRNHWPSRVTTARLDLALALSQRGSQDEAAATANQALAKATFMRRFQLEKAHEMLTALEGYSSAEAEELRERLALARLAFAARSRTDW